MNRKDYLLLGALLLMTRDNEIFSDDEIIDLFNGTDNLNKFSTLVADSGNIPKEETRLLVKEYVDRFLDTI